jgi:RNA polymerase sigma factor (sigma-70 family)
MASDSVRPPQGEPAGCDDSELLARMALADEDSPAARVAWEAFYLRHVDYLHAVCFRAYGPLLGGEAGAADLTADTFRRVYEKAGTFDPGGIADPDRLRLRTRAWLGRIAQRLALETLRQRARLPAVALDPDEWQQVAREPAAPDADALGPGAERIARVREAIESLSEREQIVLRATFQWREAGAVHSRMSNRATAELAQAVGTTPENLRQIRRRALTKIETFLRSPPAAVPGGDGHE